METYSIRRVDRWIKLRFHLTPKVDDRLQQPSPSRRSHPTKEIRHLQQIYYLERRFLI